MIIFILAFIILFIILLFLIYQSNDRIIQIKPIESFLAFNQQEEEESTINNSLCSNFYKNAFCQFDINTNKNMCKYQKDNVKIAFDAPETCCEGGCPNIDSSKTIKQFSSINNSVFSDSLDATTSDARSDATSDATKPSYYCNIGGKCKKYNGTILNSHISTNNCGTDVLNNQLLLPYSSYEECSKTLNPCDKYNNPEWSEGKIKTECLKNTNCGFCTNDSGKGKCIEGTATEPLDLNRYYYCSGDKYEYGNHAQYII